MANKKVLSGVIGLCLAGAGSANAAINYVFDTTAPPTPTPCSMSGGTAYGNSMSCTSSTATQNPQLQLVTGWANTNGNTSAAPSGTLQSAYLANYSGNLGVTNQDGVVPAGSPAGTTALDPNEGSPTSTTPPEHAIDNNRLAIAANGDMYLNPSQYIYDSVLMQFASEITLTGVTIGWKNATSSTFTNDSDITVLAYTGAGGGTASLAGRTYASLTASSDWKLVGHYSDLAVNSTQLINGAVNNTDTTSASSVSSRYWLIGAYNPLVGLGGVGATQWTTGNDYVKLYSVAGVTPGGKIPEPSSALLLFAVFGAGGWVARRRRAPTLSI